MPEFSKQVAYLRSISPTISVGLISADIMNYGSAIASLENAGVKLLHIDVMDGNFCPSLTIGPPLIKQLRTKMLLDVHLMISNPMESFDQYIDAGASMLTIPYESTYHPHRALQAIKEKNPSVIRGIALNPGTEISVVEPLLDELDMIVLLAVNPGWGGQKFIRGVKSKFVQLKALTDSFDRDILTVIDGGISLDNISDIAAMNPDIVISGSAIFKGNEIEKNAGFMMNGLKKS